MWVVGVLCTLGITSARVGAQPAAVQPRRPVINAPTDPLLAPFRFRSIGPASMGGRIDDIEVSASNPSIIYIGYAVGGVWKSENNATTFEPVFDTYGTASIGDIAIHPRNPDIVYVGTGEANNRQTSTFGDGMYKTTDETRCGVQITSQTTRHRSTHDRERAPQCIADLADRATLIPRLGLEGDLGERLTIGFRVADGVSESVVHRYAPTLSNRNAQRTHGSVRMSARTFSSGCSSTSITMNASPPRCFRVRRRVAMLMPSSDRIVAMRATEPGMSSANRTIV